MKDTNWTLVLIVLIFAAFFAYTYRGLEVVADSVGAAGAEVEASAPPATAADGAATAGYGTQERLVDLTWTFVFALIAIVVVLILSAWLIMIFNKMTPNYDILAQIFGEKNVAATLLIALPLCAFILGVCILLG